MRLWTLTRLPAGTAPNSLMSHYPIVRPLGAVRPNRIESTPCPDGFSSA